MRRTAPISAAPGRVSSNGWPSWSSPEVGGRSEAARGAQGTHDVKSTLERRRHACAFFYTPEEEARILLPYLKDGVERGDKLWYIVDPARRPELLRRLDEAGLDSVALQKSRQLDMRPWQEAHLSGGHFDKEAMLSLLGQTMADNRAEGFPRTRIWSNQEWALQDVPGVEDIVEYEARFNYIAAERDDLTVCVYDLTRFGADIVMDMLRTHPLVIIGGMIYDNPFFAPPEEFLPELRRRRAKSAGR
jgi:hypothetical protein